MSSRRGGGKPSFVGTASSSPKGKSPQYGDPSGGSNIGNNSPRVDQLNSGVANISLDSAQDGDWEVSSKKSKNRGGTSAAKTWGSKTSTKAWDNPDVQKPGMAINSGTGKTRVGTWQTQIPDSRGSLGRGNTNRGWESAYTAPPAAIAPPLANGWQWASRTGSSQSKSSETPPQGSDKGEDSTINVDQDDEDDDDDDEIVDDSDDDILSDGFDSDESQKSHGTRKKSKWFKAFFDELDKLTNEQLNEPLRQWHCPACKDGPGAIDWYRSLQPLISHAKTKGSKRVQLHRDFAELLDEELYRRGTSVIPSGEVFGKWKGLRETVKDHEIVWPPMVIIMNTKLEQDDNDKWIGMGNQELIEYFSSYAAVKARHSYGPQGHRGMSVLIFESTGMGYLEAERLHKHFAEQGTDRDAWDGRRVLFYPGGKRQLYGYMAVKEDMDIFNQHCQGKSKLKFEMRSYQEMVVVPMKQMSEDNQQLIYLKDKVVKEQRHSKVLEETFGVVSEKLRKTMEENRIVRQRINKQHEQNKEEMDCQEQFFKDQMDRIHEALEEKERAFEKQLQEERVKAKQSDADSKTKEEHKLRQEEIAKFIKSQEKGIEKFEGEREELIKLHEDKKTAMKRRHLEEEVELEKEFDDALTKLMGKYAPDHSEDNHTTATS